MRATVPAAALLLALGAAQAEAQSVEDILGRYTGQNGEGYLQPLADVVGAGLASGWTRSARIEDGFHLKLSFIMAGTPISDDRRSFSGTTEPGFQPQTTRDVPTIFGDIDPVEVPGQGGTSYVFPGGLDVSMLGLAIPQLTIGTVAGTEAAVRWFGVDVGDEFGEVSLLGGGIRHNIGRYLPGSPVDLAAGFYYNKLEIGDIFEATAMLASLNASRGMGILTLYGGLGYESSTSDITYTREGEDEEISLSLDGANSVRVNGGLSLRLAILELFADYTLASQNAFTFGISLGR